MRIVIPGGTGHIGQSVEKHFQVLGWEVVVIGRKGGHLQWDGKSLGPWSEALDGADVVLNLAGRSVNCRYNEENLRQMMTSRVESTEVLGNAIARCVNPPRVWLQSSTATIYANRLDAPNDEATGILGGTSETTDPKWHYSERIALAWEKALDEADTPRTRKVALRSAMVMSPVRGSVFSVMASLARKGLGGQAGCGRQFVSWVHELDFCRSLEFLIVRDDLAGPINVSSPYPLPNRDFNRVLREVVGAKFSFPIPVPILEAGAFVLGTETELVLKSRRVIPGRLLSAGFEFGFPHWPAAARELASRLSA
ncbi:MAG: DUF1731 domain-containing protein [Fimbriimonadaceae bacterium]|nr:DUF1731 domain-containing protein [Fimbriimonadaceae bacterium]